MSEEKIGMYTAEEILEFMTDGEGRGFMGRSMFDAMYFKIKDLQQRVEQLEKENKELKEENKHIFSKVNDDELLISNAMNYAEAQEYKLKYEQLENIRKEAIEYIKGFEDSPEYIDAYDITYWQDEVLNILNKGSEK